MVAEMLPPERGFRRPDCGDDCVVVRALLPGVFGRSELMVHDVDAHVAYGRRNPQAPDADLGIVITGPLAVDVRRHTATLDGNPLLLSATEARMLVLLARAAGAMVPSERLIREAIGWDVERVRGDREGHALRVVVARLRRRLGASEGLIETIAGLGYCLAMAEPGAPAPPRGPHHGPPRLDRWAIRWDRCQGCGTTSRPHKALGYCDRCLARVKYGSMLPGLPDGVLR